MTTLPDQPADKEKSLADKIPTSLETTPNLNRYFLHWSRSVFMIVIVVLVGVIIAAGSFYLATKNAKYISPKPITKVDETANWKTYTNTDPDFTINYPLTWTSKPQKDDQTGKIYAVQFFGANNSTNYNVYIIWGTGFGGVEKCDSHPQIKLKNEILTACGGKNISGFETLYLSQKLSSSESLEIRTITSKHVDQQNILKMLSTFKFLPSTTPSVTQQTSTTSKTIASPIPTNKPPGPTSTPAPTNLPTPTPLAQQGKPVMNISYPQEGQSISLNSSQTFCVVDVPVANTRGLQRKENTGSGWNDYHATGTLCYDPQEGANTLQLQYKNDSNQESDVYTVHFTFHHE